MHNILVITYWSYDDALVQTYTLPYLRIIARNLPEGSHIHLLTLEKNKNAAPVSADTSIKLIPLSYSSFGIKAFFFWLRTILQLYFVIRKYNIKTLHAWCTPAGMIGYLLSVLTGKDLIIDSYEPHAEAMVENGSWKKNSIAYRLLFYFEKLQTLRARYLIAANAGMKQYAKEKYGYEGMNYFVKPACVDLSLFSPDKQTNEILMNSLGLNDKITCIYTGKFGGIYLEKEVFDFFSEAYRHWKDEFRVLLLTNHTNQEIEKLCIQSGLPIDIFRVCFVPHRQIPPYMELADFAITPVKPVPSKRYCSPIKDGEYWAMGLPVIITNNISEDSAIIENNNAGYVLKGLSTPEYRNAIAAINTLLRENKNERAARIRKLACTFRNFNIAEEIYREIYGKHYL